jgi:hypothetical protein
MQAGEYSVLEAWRHSTPGLPMQLSMEVHFCHWPNGGLEPWTATHEVSQTPYIGIESRYGRDQGTPIETQTTQLPAMDLTG